MKTSFSRDDSRIDYQLHRNIQPNPHHGVSAEGHFPSLRMQSPLQLSRLLYTAPLAHFIACSQSVSAAQSARWGCCTPFRATRSKYPLSVVHAARLGSGSVEGTLCPSEGSASVEHALSSR